MSFTLIQKSSSSSRCCAFQTAFALLQWFFFFFSGIIYPKVMFTLLLVKEIIDQVGHTEVKNNRQSFDFWSSYLRSHKLFFVQNSKFFVCAKDVFLPFLFSSIPKVFQWEQLKFFFVELFKILHTQSIGGSLLFLLKNALFRFWNDAFGRTLFVWMKDTIMGFVCSM